MFLAETDVDSYLYYIILAISLFHHRIVRVSKASNKKSFASKVFHFCDSKLQQRFILKKEVSVSKKQSESLLDKLAEFLKAFDQVNKYRRFRYPKQTCDWTSESKMRTVQSLLQRYSWAIEQTYSIMVPVWKENTCVFFIKNFEK